MPAQARGIEAAGIDDDPHPAVHGEPEAFLHLPQECLGVPSFRILEPVAGEDEHGQLGEVVAGEHVELTTIQHLTHGGEPVAVET